ncbi:unnamed protein product [Mucor hiemalis]
MQPSTLILDNGASTIKTGVCDYDCAPRLISNAIVRGKVDKRNYIGDQLEEWPISELGIEKTIWDRVINNVARVYPKESRLLITEPCFNLPIIQDSYDEVIFEEYEFSACYRTIAAELCLYNELSELFGDKYGSIPECVLIVDSGYSFTHIVPFLKGRAVARGIRRLNVGGKLLTNQLKEIVTFRSYDMMEETYIINDVKEKCCYISQDVYGDLDICKKRMSENTIIQEYVLPDFTHNATGIVRTPTSNYTTNKKKDMASEQVLAMNNERFMIPEILMHPSDVGLDQAGIPEAIAQSVDACDPSIQGLLFANIVLVGGNAKIPGYMERIKRDLRQLVNSDFDIRMVTPRDPVTFAWEGGNRFVSLSSKNELQKSFVQRREYLEYGGDICRRKFGSL